MVVEPIGQEFALNDTQLGFLVGMAYGLPFAIAGVPFGYLVDRVNRRRFLAFMLSLWSLLTAVCGFAQSYLQLIAARMAVGTAEAGFPAAHSMIADYFPAKKRPMALGIFVSGGSFAFILTFALGGLIAEAMGWRAVFFVAGVPGLLLALLFFLTVREPYRGGFDDRSELTDQPAPGIITTFRYLFGRRSFTHLFIGYVLTAASTSAFWSWITSLMIRVHGLSVGEAGLYVAAGAGVCSFIGAVSGALFVGRLAERSIMNVLTFITLAAVILGPVGIAMSLAPNLQLTLALMVFVGLLKSSYPGPAQGLILSLAQPKMRGVSASLLMVMGTLLGFGAGPLIAGTISTFLGGGTAIRYGLAILFLLNFWAGIHFLFARKTLEVDIMAASGAGVLRPSAA